MKTAQKRFKVETLYILGAGASFALTETKPRKGKRSRHTTPLDKDFLRSLSVFSSRGWQKEDFEKVQSNWLGRSDFLGSGLEEAIIKRVSAFEFLSETHPRRLRGKCRNEDYLIWLTCLISNYLTQCKESPSGFAETFVKQVFPHEKVEKQQNRIISFNYDLIIDKHLILRRFSNQDIYFQGIESAQRPSPKKRDFPLLLKLHGSVNWRCPATYFKNLINGTLQDNPIINISVENENTPRPHDDEAALIIPPIPSKPITKAGMFAFLWTRAFEYLTEAKRIVIAGYSCPETDAYARVLFSQFRNSEAFEVVIVDPSTQVLDKYMELMKNCFGSKTKWRYQRSFKEFISSEPD